MLTHGSNKDNRQIDAHKGHIASSSVHTATRYGTRYATRPPNAIRKAVDALFPWTLDRSGESYKPLYRGYKAALAELVFRRASTVTARQWVIGTRSAPAWFVSLLRDRLLQRRAEIDQALAELDAMPERRGTGAGLRDWHREKKRRESEAQAAREKQSEHNRILRGS